MKVHLRNVHTREQFTLRGIGTMNRLRTDKKGAENRAGWLLRDADGLSVIYDDTVYVTAIEEELGKLQEG